MLKNRPVWPFFLGLILAIFLSGSCQSPDTCQIEGGISVPVKIVNAGVDPSGNLIVTIEDSSGRQSQYEFTREALVDSAGSRGSFARPENQMMIPPYLLGLSGQSMWYLDPEIEGSIMIPAH